MKHSSKSGQWFSFGVGSKFQNDNSSVIPLRFSFFNSVRVKDIVLRFRFTAKEEFFWNCFVEQQLLWQQLKLQAT